MSDMERIYWVDKPTLQECIEKGRVLNAVLVKRGIPCDVGVIGVIGDDYEGHCYCIELGGYEDDGREAAMQFNYQQLKDILAESGIDIALTACRLELG